jgi:DNA-binding response OmpR family regulator
VLVVEDEPEISSLLRTGLIFNGAEVECVTGIEAATVGLSAGTPMESCAICGCPGTTACNCSIC